MSSIQALRGKPKRAVAASIVGELSLEDLLLAQGERKPEGSGFSPVKALRHTHHRIAQLLASGYKNFEVAAIVGYSESRISILLADPTFRDLVEFYRKEQRTAELDIHGRLQALTADALEALVEKVHDGEVTVGQLIEAVKLGADRVGHGPGSTLDIRSVSVSGADLRALKEEVNGSAVGRLIAKADQEPSLGQIPRAQSLAQLAAEGSEGEGEDLREEGAARTREDAPDRGAA